MGNFIMFQNKRRCKGMETVEQNIQQDMEKDDVQKKFMELFHQQNMEKQSKDFIEFFQYVESMQLQLSMMVDVLQDVKEQLSQMQKNQPESVKEKLMNKVSYLQEKVTNLLEHLSAIKDYLVETVMQAVNAFKEKGKAEMCKVLQKGISGIKAVLTDYREHLSDVILDYQKTINQIDSIGEQLKQIGNGVSNVGRLLTGKSTKEMSNKNSGVGLTRAVNKPIKKAVENLQKNMDTVDKTFEKLNQLTKYFDTRKEAEKGERASIKGKLLQMKTKVNQQKKTPEQDKAKNKEVCL